MLRACLWGAAWLLFVAEASAAPAPPSLIPVCLTEAPSSGPTYDHLVVARGDLSVVRYQTKCKADPYGRPFELDGDFSFVIHDLDGGSLRAGDRVHISALATGRWVKPVGGARFGTLSDTPGAYVVHGADGALDYGATIELRPEGFEAPNPSSRHSYRHVMREAPQLERWTGHLQIGRSGKCVDKTRSMSSGRQAHAWTCDETNANQRFVLPRGADETRQIQSVASGLCLQPEGGATAKGTRLVQAPCDAAAPQWFQKTSLGSDWFRLKLRDTNVCIDLQGGGFDNGTKLLLWTCNTGNANQWLSWLNTAARHSERANTRTFQVRHSKLCLDGGGTSKGTQAVQRPCNVGDVDQRYTLVHVRGAYYTVRSRRTGRCLDVSGASRDNGAKVVGWDCGSQRNQQWSLEYGDPGWFQLKARHSGKCLDQRGPSKKEGAVFHQWSCKDIANQQFRFVE